MYHYATHVADARALHSDQTPDGVGSIWLTNVQCMGTESRLAFCPSSPPGVQDCNHDGDVGVVCQPSTTGKEHFYSYPIYGAQTSIPLGSVENKEVAV